MFSSKWRFGSHRLGLIFMISCALVIGAAPLPKAMAQDTTAVPTDRVADAPVQLDEGLQDRPFFTEPPVDETIDTQGGQAGLENEVDTFPYTPNVFPQLAGIESAADSLQNLFLPSIAAPGVEQEARSLSVAAVKTFYVDCAGGNDGRSGLSTGEAWKSLNKANAATLMPGDSLLLKRGCSWTGPLVAKWQGTSTQPITIGAYGSGELPKVQNGYTVNVRISGKYQIIQDIHATMSVAPNPDPNCNNQPRGWKAGFSFDSTASYNTVRAVKATRLTIGVFFHLSSHHNKLFNSTITDNNVLEQLTSTSAHGASGVSLHGNYQEIARNYFANNRSICTYNGVVESISIELYTASNSSIHHNTIYNDRVFVEMGSNSTWRSENNTLAYNLFVNSYAHATMGTRFLVTRGYGHSFGPVLNTKVINNVVYLTGSGAKGISCEKCDYGILTARNNVLWANDEPFSSDNRFTESNNIFWSNDGSPGLQWRGLTLSPSSYIANPQFTNPGANNFTLLLSSPAINHGTVDIAAGYTWDLAGNLVPVAGVVDIGAYEVQ